jgi:hypothetical protein
VWHAQPVHSKEHQVSHNVTHVVLDSTPTHSEQQHAHHAHVDNFNNYHNNQHAQTVHQGCSHQTLELSHVQHVQQEQ